MAKKRPSADLATLLERIASRDAPGVLELVAARPELARERVAADRLFERLHWVYRGDTALHLAAAALDVESLESLLAAGAEARATNRRGASALHYACDPRPRGRLAGAPEGRQRATIERLVAAGAVVSLADAGGATPLHRAVRARSPEAVRALLEHGADLNARLGKQRTTPLHLAVQGTGAGGTADTLAEQLAIVRLLVAHGASARSKDAKGKTPRDAARNEVVRRALELDSRS